MKKIALFFALAFIASSGALAGGAATGGASEWTQVLNHFELVMQYAQQLKAYENQLQQYQTMVANLQKNPDGVSLSNINQMASNSAKLTQYGSYLGQSLASIDQQLATTYGNADALSYANKFSSWTASSMDGFKAALRNAGVQRQQFGDDTSALQGAMTKLASSEGNLSALQALGQLNAQQIQETMKLRDLISQQQVAQGNYMMAQGSKQAEDDKLRKALSEAPNAEVKKLSDFKEKAKALK